MATRSRSLFLLAALWAASAQAQVLPNGPPARGKPPSQDSSLPDSVRRVERQTGGEVLRAEPMQRDGREVYRLKVLTSDGRVRVMQDDPHERHDDPSPAARQGKPTRKSHNDPATDRDGDTTQF